MSNRDIILKKIKDTNIIKYEPLPAFDNFAITYDNKIDKFMQSIKEAGGDAIICDNNINTIIKNLFPKAQMISSNVKECEIGNFDTNNLDKPTSLKNIDLAIIQGEFAVAENGAVWINNKNNKHRALYFIANDLIIVIKKNNIVNNMHEAYNKINPNDISYGIFISGPSKTADIEQSLVIGAHGAISTYVLLI